MKQLLQFSWMQFWRNLFLRTLYLCLLLLLNGYALYALLGNVFLGGVHLADPMRFLHTMQSMGLLFYLFFLFIGYAYFYETEHVRLTETFQASPSGASTVRGVQLLFLGLLAAVPVCCLLLWTLVCCITQQAFSGRYLLHALLAYLLDFFLPGVIALLIGMALSFHKKKLSAYAVILLLLFLALPISQRIPALLSGPTGSSIYPFRVFDLFLLQPYNLKYEAMYGYGVPMERYRWMIVLFWLFFLTAVLIWHSRGQIVSKTGRAAGCVCLALSLCFFGLSMQRNCYLYDGQRADSTMMFDQVYMLDLGENANKSQAAGFRVDEYDMALRITDQLFADVTLRLSYDTPPDAYRFTLQRTMQIDGIDDGAGTSLAYRQDGNYLEIEARQDAPLSQIHLRYHGYDNNFYTNRQGVSLPAYYPYYPMPGYHACYDLTTQNYNAAYPRAASQYRVRVDYGRPLLCNLPSAGDNIFSGTAEGLTLKSGFLSEDTREGIRLIYPTDIDQQKSLDLSRLADLDAVLDDYSATLGIDLRYPLQNKTIMIDETAYHPENGAVYDDHLVLSYVRNSQQVAVELIRNTLPDMTEKTDLKTLFLRELYSGHAIADSIKFKEQGDRYASLSVPLQEKIDAYGQPYVMRQVYQYLLDEANHTDPAAWIASIA